MSEVGPSRVFVDANIWYSRTLTDWLLMLSIESSPPPYYVYWSEDVLAEAIHHLRKKHPDWSGHRISLIRDRMVATLTMDMRVAEYTIDANFEGRDPDDAHVHSAALACGAGYLLTANLADFSQGSNDQPYEVIDPDTFFCLINEAAPALVRSVTAQQMTYWCRKRPEAKLSEYLRKSGCPEFAAAVARHAAAIGGVPYLIPPM